MGPEPFKCGAERRVSPDLQCLGCRHPAPVHGDVTEHCHNGRDNGVSPHSSDQKTAMLAFFDSQGLIYSHIVPKVSAVNGKYIVKALGNFLQQLKKKRPVMVQQEWWFHWDNAPVHTAAVVLEWFAAHNIQQLEHPPYLPDLAPADFFLFRRVKEELAGWSLDEGTLKKTWEGVTRNIATKEFANAFWQ
jgi:hypothetical protein